MASVEVIVPWRAGCYWRDRSWAWLEPRWEWPVRVAEFRGGTWVKALATMPAIKESTADIVVVADADVLCDGVYDAISAVEHGAPWAVPHKWVCRLTAASTWNFKRGRGNIDFEERPYVGVEGGGILVARRETLLDIPLDPRFVGWGQEDESWGIALHHLAGQPWRGGAQLFHLWHPSQERWTRTRGSVDGWALRRRYFKARFQDGAMRALIEEAQDALAPAYADMRNHAQVAV